MTGLNETGEELPPRGRFIAQTSLGLVTAQQPPYCVHGQHLQRVLNRRPPRVPIRSRMDRSAHRCCTPQAGGATRWR